MKISISRDGPLSHSQFATDMPCEKANPTVPRNCSELMPAAIMANPITYQLSFPWARKKSFASFFFFLPDQKPINISMIK